MIEKALQLPRNDKEVVKEEEPEKAYTPEEEEEIKKKLKSLGYL